MGILSYSKDSKQRVKRKQEVVNRNSNFPVSNSQFPLVSIIVTTKNEEKNIANCLESIKAQNLSSQFPIPNFHSSIEIIVVDNNSTDRTKEIARRYTDKVYNFGPERSAQRNFGVREASGKYILYLDADMTLSENVISECVEKFKEGETEEGKRELVALYIPERIVDLSSGESISQLLNQCNQGAFNLRNQCYWTKVRDFERSFYNATAIDCVRFIRRDKFLEIGGFDENLTGPEDWDFDRRINDIGKVDIINIPLCHNEAEFNLKKYITKKSYYAKSFDKYTQKWGKDDRIIRKQLGLWYRFFGVFVENGKWKKMLKHPMLTLGMFFLRLAVGIRFSMRCILITM